MLYAGSGRKGYPEKMPAETSAQEHGGPVHDKL